MKCRESCSALTAITTKPSPANTAASAFGMTTTQALTTCRSANAATMTTTPPANAAGALFTAITPTTTMTITPTATGAMRNAVKAQSTSTVTSLTRFSTATRSAIMALNLKSTRAERTAITQIRFWVSATGLRNESIFARLRLK